MRTGTALTFTSNIVFPDGFETLPGTTPVAESALCQTALRHLELTFDGDKSDVKVADLGCLEGGYSLAFAKEGYAVFGYEARTENYLCCQLVKREWGLDKLQFFRADVRDIVANEVRIWDAVFCSGLLYHLNDPVAFLGQLGRATRKLLILDTHYSTHPDAEHEGMSGHWYEEGSTRWSSVWNKRSFWLAKDDLLGAIHLAGFDQVIEIEDDRIDRCTLIAAKV